jgi:choline-sulfatase
VFGPSTIGLGASVRRINAALKGRFSSHLARVTVFGLAAALALVTVVTRPPSLVLVEMLERDTPVMLPWLLELYAPSKIGDVTIPNALLTSFQARKGRPDLKPTPQRFLGPGPIVIFITIDALRLEVLDPKNRKVAPNLQEIKEHSVYFSQARSPGSDTRTSLAALFLGRHFSMLNWNWSGSRGRPTLEKDLEPRFPELLQRAKVQTVTAISAEDLLVPRIGISRGFDEQLERTKELSDKPRTEEVVDQAIERLRRQGPGPLFFYAHILDPHAPYHRRGAQVDSEYEAYLVEVSLSDKHLGRLRKAVQELGLSDRTALIVSSDHGEGFGEHGVFHHNKTLYEVMVHVPLMIEIPGVKPRVVDDFVSLMDAGPTILDLFQVPTPGYWMADSLVPFITGGRVDPNRVLFMEKSKERAMLFPDGLKVISRGVAEELYDVRKDPAERENLWDSMGDEARRRMGLMQAYSDLHSGRSQPSKEEIGD